MARHIDDIDNGGNIAPALDHGAATKVFVPLQPVATPATAGGSALMTPVTTGFDKDALVAPDDIMSAGTAGGGGTGATTLIPTYNPTTGRYQYSGNQDIDGTLSGYTWTGTNLTYSFPTDKTFYGAGYAANGSTSVANNFVVTNEAQQAAARAAFAMISSYTLLTFTEITESATEHATIRISQSTSNYVPSAFGYYPATHQYAGDIWIGKSSSNPQPFYLTPAKGNWGYVTIFHEIGHTMGLKHGHETDNVGAVPAERDGWAWSVMTYYSDPTNTTPTFQGDEFSQPQTYMQDDIAAMQYMYGANFTTNSGDSVYTVSATTGELFINGVGQGTPTSNKTFLTIWDGGGTDSYDFSNFTGDQTIDLTPGGWSTDNAAALIDTRPLDSGLTLLAPGNIANALLYNGDLRSLIENATAGSGNDVLLGNQIANTLNGGAGNDLINGAAGADTLIGGTGNDTFVVDDAGDMLVEAAGAGTDEVWSTLTAYSLGATIENLRFFASGVTGTGNALNNAIYGYDGNDTLNADAGHDYIDGGLGADNMTGGTGNDTFVIDNAGDVIVEVSGGGADLVLASISYALIPNVENLTLLGAADLTATGNSVANILTGNAGNNLLDGRGGADRMLGGLGNDTYTVDNVGDVIVEAVGEGTDTVNSSVTYSLGAGVSVEAFNLIGTAALNATGNELANAITGNSAANLIDGGAGADTMTGGAGNDTFIVDDIGDIIVELSGGGGTDLVLSSVTYTIVANIEKLTLTGSGNIGATGNSAANILTGNTGNNLLDGKAGADTMIGGLGDDTYTIDNAGDVATENAGEGIDTIRSVFAHTLAVNFENLVLTGSANIDGTGNAANNAITGNAGLNNLYGLEGNDYLDGGAGADTMTGGTGNDSYVIDNVGDLVVELSGGGGTDTILSSISYTLLANSENLTLTGAANIDGAGNSAANILIGNGGDNLLNGKTGNDVLTGGGGADTFLFLAGSGADTITDFNTGEEDRINLNAYSHGVAGAGVVISQTGGNVLIDLGGGNTITVLGATAADPAFQSHIIW